MYRLYGSALVFAATALAGCSADAPTGPSLAASPEASVLRGAHDSETPASMNQMLAALRAATAPFHNLQEAVDAGYVSTVECASHPTEGAMGVHFANFGLMGDATYELRHPELLVYEPQKNGRMRLVAAAYVIFRTPWEMAGNTSDPVFGDVPFVRNFGEDAHGLPDHYELHIWLWKHNPAGMFEEWNPTVSCANAAH